MYFCYMIFKLLRLRGSIIYSDYAEQNKANVMSLTYWYIYIELCVKIVHQIHSSMMPSASCLDQFPILSL